MTNDQISNNIKELLCIKKELVGIKVWKEEPQNIPKYEGNAFPGMCTQIAEVLKTGKTFHTNREHCFCTGGVVATGVVPPPSGEEKIEVAKVHLELSKDYKDLETSIHYDNEMEKLLPMLRRKMWPSSWDSLRRLKIQTSSSYFACQRQQIY